jgi:predicted membrane-bound spermidine synthase
LALVPLDRPALELGDSDLAGTFAHQALVSWSVLSVMLVHIAGPALLMGCAYPLANANIQDASASVGRRAGILYLANTIGAVLGSLLTGFWLIPGLALKGSMTALAVVGSLSVVALFASGRRVRLPAFAACAVALGLAIALWVRVPASIFQRHGIFAGEKILSISEGVNELIVVTEAPNGSRRLKTNGHNMSGTDIEAQRYMRAFVHLPLLHIDEPRSVLVICFGVGTTLHAASLYPSIEHLEVADLSRHVVEQSTTSLTPTSTSSTSRACRCSSTTGGSTSACAPREATTSSRSSRRPSALPACHRSTRASSTSSRAAD